MSARIVDAKATGTAGRAVALVSVFGNVDLGGDRVMPGAFTASLEQWRAKGDPIPVIWSHDWDNPESYVGQADPSEVKETPAGLEVPMVFDLERPRAEQVFHLLKSRRVTQFSFGYYASDAEVVEDPEYGQVRELRAVDLFEVGPTLLGMNPETELLEAASALRRGKSGRVLSAKNEGLIRDAHTALGEVLATVGDSGKAARVQRKAAAVKEVDVPAYVAENAARGLAYYEDGLGGDGLEEQTIRDARAMAAGSVSVEKVQLMGPWIARHVVDLEAPQNSDPSADGYPGPGLVAMLLWGGGPDVAGARRTQEWAEQAAAEYADKSAKATAAEAVEGAFVTWTTEDEQYVGRIEHVMTEGVLGVPDSVFQVEASEDDPAILVRLFEDSEEGWTETALFTGARASQVAVIPDPREQVEDTAGKATDTDDTGTGDTVATIDQERVLDLLTRPRHVEEQWPS